MEFTVFCNGPRQQLTQMAYALNAVFEPSHLRRLNYNTFKLRLTRMEQQQLFDMLQEVNNAVDQAINQSSAKIIIRYESSTGEGRILSKEGPRRNGSVSTPPEGSLTLSLETFCARPTNQEKTLALQAFTAQYPHLKGKLGAEVGYTYGQAKRCPLVVIFSTEQGSDLTHGGDLMIRDTTGTPRKLKLLSGTTVYSPVSFSFKQATQAKPAKRMLMTAEVKNALFAIPTDVRVTSLHQKVANVKEKRKKTKANTESTVFAANRP